MKYQGVFFDFDYTIGDSTYPITVGYRQGLAAMGWPEPTVDQVRHTVRYTLMDGYTMLTGDPDPDRQQQFYQLFQQAVIADTADRIIVGPGLREIRHGSDRGGSMAGGA